MRFRVAFAAFSALGAGWLACSSFEDAQVTDSPDGSASDATSDDSGDGTDALATADAGPDGCTAFFCDGFERDANLGNGWTDLTAQRHAALSLSDRHPRSGTGSLQLVLYGDAGLEAGRTAQLMKSLPAGSARAVLDFWIYYSAPPSSDTTIANLTLDDDSNLIILMRLGGGFALNEQFSVDGSKKDNDVGVGSIGNDKPRHVRLEVGRTLFDGGRPGARLSIDDESSELALENPNTNARPAKVWLGAGYSQPGPRTEDTLFYDDVTVDVTSN